MEAVHGALGEEDGVSEVIPPPCSLTVLFYFFLSEISTSLLGINEFLVI